MRLIDADKLKKHIWDMSSHALNEWSTIGVCAAIDRQPTAEAKPVRHGEWIAINNPSYSPFDGSEPRKYICSECKSVIPHARAYCSECGSKNDKITLERSEAMREMKMDGATLGG